MKNYLSTLSITIISIFLWGCSGEGPSVENAIKEDAIDSKIAEKKKSSAVEVIEFFDFGCGHCRNASQTVSKLKKKFGESLQVTHKHFPLSPRTFKVAEASECARSQGKYLEFQEIAFANFGKYEQDQILGYAKDIGLDEAAFTTCWENGDKKAKVLADQKEGSALGVTGTPFFLVNGTTKIPGAPSESAFSKMIEDLLAKGHGQQ